MDPKNDAGTECWRKIGVYGDGSCPELEAHIHCRNCPVYSAAGIRLLDRPLPPNHLREWTQHLSQPRLTEAAHTKSAFIFRVSGEWLALPSILFLEVSEMRAIHSLPHRRRGAVLGLVNIRGELLICISLAALLGVEPSKDVQRADHPRLLVVNRNGSRFVFPADEVHGTHRYDSGSLKPAPATVANSTAACSGGVLAWRDKSVGCLDEEALFSALNRSLA